MNGRRKNPTMEEGTFILLPHEVFIEPIEIDDFMGLNVSIVQNNGRTNKTKGRMTMGDLMRKML